jgi:YMGG-like Gly-zipper
MNKAIYLILALLTFSSAGFAADASTVVGGALGGAAGAAIGQNVGGQEGAILGAALGGAAGAAIGSDGGGRERETRSIAVGSAPVYREDDRHPHNRGYHYGERKHHHEYHED